MALFGKKSATQRATASHSPKNVAAMMERFGRHEFYTPESSDDPAAVWSETQEPLLAIASHDADRFLELVADAVVPVGGWSAYGGAHTAWNLLNPPVRELPAYRAIVDASLEFLRSNGVPPMRVNRYEWEHWLSNGGTVNSWLPQLPIPAASASRITDLTAGETRKVAQLSAYPDSNVIFVRLDDDGRYTAVIDAKWSGDDPRRVQNPWKSAGSLYDLYVDLGLGFQVPTFWAEPELMPYFPLPRPRI